MRFLADMVVSLTTVEALRAADHDAIHLRDEGLIRLPDPDIAAKAVIEGRIVLTFDLDFGEILAAARSGAPRVVVFRLRNQTPAAVNPRLFQVIKDCAAELASGAIVIVEDNGFRVRRLPIRPEYRAPGPALLSSLADLRGVIWPRFPERRIGPMYESPTTR